MLSLGPISCSQGGKVTWQKIYQPRIRSIKQGWVSMVNEKNVWEAFLLRNAYAGCLVLGDNIRQQISVVLVKHAISVLDPGEKGLRSLWSGVGTPLLTILRINFSGWHKVFMISSFCLPFQLHFQLTGSPCGRWMIVPYLLRCRKEELLYFFNFEMKHCLCQNLDVSPIPNTFPVALWTCLFSGGQSSRLWILADISTLLTGLWGKALTVIYSFLYPSNRPRAWYLLILSGLLFIELLLCSMYCSKCFICIN